MSVRHFVKHLHSHPLLRPTRALTTLSAASAAIDLPKSPPKDPYSLMKEDPIQICSDLWVRTFSDPARKPFPKLSGFLAKFDLWVLAYQRCCAHFTGTFPPRRAVHAHVLAELLDLRDAVVHGHYRWNQKVDPYIRSPNDKTPRTLLSKTKRRAILESDEPCFQDRVVQEVLLMILEPIFEARFSSKSHGFRPGRNAHTVIRTVRSNFAGYLWFLRGDLSDLLEHVDAGVVIACVGKAVKDRKVLALLKSALGTKIKSPVILEEPDSGVRWRKEEKKEKKKGPRRKVLREDEPKPDPYWLRTFFDFAPEEATKVPCYGHCGILSPLLANICLHELDDMMEDKIVEFFRPSKLDSIWKHSITDGCHNPAWPEFVPTSGREKTRKMDYIRYAGHFLIGIRGRRGEAVDIRKRLIEFCDRTYGLRLNNVTISLEHITRGIQFLDHIICRRVIFPTLRYTSSGGSVVSQKGVGTLLSVTACLQQCIRLFRKLRLVKGDRDPEPLPCSPMLYCGQAHTNSQMNKFLETMADWYRYADNRKKVVGFCAYVIRSSLAKLYAARYKLKSRAKVYKIASRDLSRPLIKSTNTKSAPEYSDLLRMGLVDTITGVQFAHMSSIPSCDYTPLPRNWVPPHEQVLREYIRLDDPKFFCGLYRSVKREGFCAPQEGISEVVWDYKTLGVYSRRSNEKEERRDEFKDEKITLQCETVCD